MKALLMKNCDNIKEIDINTDKDIEEVLGSKVELLIVTNEYNKQIGLFYSTRGRNITLACPELGKIIYGDIIITRLVGHGIYDLDDSDIYWIYTRIIPN